MIYATTKPYTKRLLEAIRTTWDTPNCQVVQHAGLPYPLVRPRHDALLEVDHTDGIGTKGVTHFRHKQWAWAVQDALAMNLNDLLAVRAVPYKVQNHLVMQEDDHEGIVSIVETLAGRCREYGIAMTGGETSIMNTVEGMDLTLTVTGFVNKLRGSIFSVGHTLIGLPSSGVHSNGWSHVRRWGGPNIQEWSTPTVIYYDKVHPQLDWIEGVVHVAGGGLFRLRDVLPENGVARLKRWDVHPDVLGRLNSIFKQWWEMKPSAYDPEVKMYSVFNCGIGMILAVEPENVERVLTHVGGTVIGTIEDGGHRQVTVESVFSDRTLNLQR